MPSVQREVQLPPLDQAPIARPVQSQAGLPVIAQLGQAPVSVLAPPALPQQLPARPALLQQLLLARPERSQVRDLALSSSGRQGS